MENLTQHLTSISKRPRSGPPPGRRLVALILSATLVIASLSPGFALAGEADSEGEGTTPPIEVPVGPPDFDPGGEEEGLEEVPAATEEEAVVEPEAEVEIEASPAPEEITAPVAEAPVEPAPPPPPIAEPEPEDSDTVQEKTTGPSEPVSNAEIVAPPQKPAAASADAGSGASGVPAPPAEPVEEGGEAVPHSASLGDEERPAPEHPEQDLAGTDSYVVRPGDCLWHIAAAMLPADSDARDIAAKVVDLWHLNRDRIGDDPNLIYPGTVLRLH